MFKQKELMIIEDEKAIKLLRRNNFKAFYFLKPFFNEARTLKEAGIETFTPPSSYYYWIKKFLTLGLVKTVRQDEGNRAKETYYLASAKKMLLRVDNDTKLQDFYIAAGDEYQGQIINMMSESCKRIKDEIGLLFSRGEHGDLSGQIVSLADGDRLPNLKDELLKESSPPAYASWQEIPLKHADAKALQRRLAELMTEYREKANSDEKRYLLQLAIVPKE